MLIFCLVLENILKNNDFRNSTHVGNASSRFAVSEKNERIKKLSLNVGSIYKRQDDSHIGTGFIFFNTKDHSYILTNQHVVDEWNCSDISFFNYGDQTEVKCEEIEMKSSDLDFALIKTKKIDTDRFYGVTKRELDKGESIFLLSAGILNDRKLKDVKKKQIVYIGDNQTINLNENDEYSNVYMFESSPCLLKWFSNFFCELGDTPTRSKSISSDTYFGDSGSPVFSGENELVGLFFAGYSNICHNDIDLSTSEHLDNLNSNDVTIVFDGKVMKYKEAYGAHYISIRDIIKYIKSEGTNEEIQRNLKDDGMF